VISEEGIRPQKKKIEAMEGYPKPIILKELQAFLGATNYYRKFISNFADISRPLIDLTRGCKTKDGKTKLAWTQEALDAFHKLRTVLSEDIVLKFPDFSRPFVLVTDASKTAIGGALQQEDNNGTLRPLSYFSRQLKGAELNYSTVEREALAIVYGLKINRTLIQGFPVIVHTDHRPLRYLFSSRDGNERLARWRMSVAEFDICVEYLPGKDNHLADALSRIRAADQPIDDLVVGVVTRRATASYKGINRLDSPRSEMVDSSDSSSCETIDIWGLDSLRIAQDKDPLWGRVKSYLRGESDLTKDEFKGIPGNIENYQVRPDGILYNVLDKPFRKVFRVVVPKVYQSTALRLAHSIPVAGHGGVLVTLKRLELFAFFPNMKKIVKEYCSSCDICLRCKPGKHIPVPLLRYPEVSRPFERVHMDIVGPYPESEGFRYILTVVDALTKYLFAIPLKSKDSLEVAKAFMNGFIYKEGTPRQIISDGGGEFVNELFKTLTKEFGIDKRTITPYHPSSNGQVERVNGTLNKILRTMVWDNPSVWARMLPMAELAYNTAYHRVIKDTPFFTLKHRDPHFPYILFSKDTAPWYNVEDYLQETRVMGSRIFKRCKEHIEEDIQRRPRDRPYAKPSQIIEGDRVYLKATPKVGLSKKVQPLYSGPYRVIEKINDVVLKIKRIADGKERKEHVDRLKLEKSLVRGQAHNIDKAYPTEEKIEEFEDDNSLETLEVPEKYVDLRKKGKHGAYYLRSRK